MKISPGLGMDPAGAWQTIRDNFLLYVQTAFGTRFPGLERERERLLRREGTFCREPWIEPLPRYQGSGKTIATLDEGDVPGFSDPQRRRFQELAACGLVGEFELHRHQAMMLRLALAGKDCVVTAGTGSGKTEAFLLPVFAYLAREAVAWQAPGELPPHWGDWWCNAGWQDECNPLSGDRHRMLRSFRVSQRGHERRDAAVRALILYPMNALVEDQLTRLRKALTSPAAEAWFGRYCPGNRIYFGRYNSKTPVPGHELTRAGNRDTQRIRRLARELTAIELAAQRAEQRAGGLERPAQEAREAGLSVPRAAREAERLAQDTRYFFPRLDRGEMRCRWDMQEEPPDILITNNSMLSIMLMRAADAPIFKKTRDWLAKDRALFHLILDELHLYRGTAGTEVAYLLRLLLHRLGLHPGHPKLRILASSASLEPDDPDSLKFLNQFFGEGWTKEQIIPGYPRTVEPHGAPEIWLAPPFARLARCVASGEDIDMACTGIVDALGGARGGPSPEHDLQNVLEKVETGTASRLLSACARFDPETSSQQVRAVPLRHFSRGVFGSAVSEEMAWDAARGLLIARSLCDQMGEPSSLPAFRIHWFFRNIEGLWGCTLPGCGCAGDEQGEGRTIGKLFDSGRVLCDHPSTPHRVLELLYCEQCGTTFFGGSRLPLPDNEGWELLNTDPDIEGIPDRQMARFVDRRTHQEYGIFWPAGGCALHEEAASGWDQPHLSGENTAGAEWAAASLHVANARVVLGAEGPSVEDGGMWVAGYIYHLPGDADGSQGSAVSALPSVCPACGSDYSRRKYRRSPVRGFRTGFSRVSQLLCKELFYQLPRDEPRKLVVFSDSREDAASISNGIERYHYSDLVREALVDELAGAVEGEAALLEDIEQGRSPYRPEAQTYADRTPGAAERLRQLVDDAALDLAGAPRPTGGALSRSGKRPSPRSTRSGKGLRPAWSPCPS